MWWKHIVWHQRCLIRVVWWSGRDGGSLRPDLDRCFTERKSKNISSDQSVFIAAPSHGKLQVEPESMRLKLKGAKMNVRSEESLWVTLPERYQVGGPRTRPTAT